MAGFRFGRMLELGSGYLLRPLLERVACLHTGRARAVIAGISGAVYRGSSAVRAGICLAGLVVRHIRGESAVALLPGWNESL